MCIILLFFKSGCAETDEGYDNRADIEHLTHNSANGENENVVNEPKRRNAEKLKHTDGFTVVGPHSKCSHKLCYERNKGENVCVCKNGCNDVDRLNRNEERELVQIFAACHNSAAVNIDKIEQAACVCAEKKKIKSKKRTA